MSACYVMYHIESPPKRALKLIHLTLLLSVMDMVLLPDTLLDTLVVKAKVEVTMGHLQAATMEARRVATMDLLLILVLAQPLLPQAATMVARRVGMDTVLLQGTLHQSLPGTMEARRVGMDTVLLRGTLRQSRPATMEARRVATMNLLPDLILPQAATMEARRVGMDTVLLRGTLHQSRLATMEARVVTMDLLLARRGVTTVITEKEKIRKQNLLEKVNRNGNELMDTFSIVTT